ncbi:MAG: VanW family protein [Anaerolineales bacterium]|nr:MAG: VanW family protein [Anaerolineales bacterium]
MSTRTATRQMNLPKPGLLPQIFMVLVGGLALFILLLLTFTTGYGLYFAGRIYPGVSVAGMELSGKTLEEANALLSQQLSYPESGHIIFQAEQAWVAKPSEVGLYLDPQTSALAAYNLGRQGSYLSRWANRFKAWNNGIDLPPLHIFDQRVAYRFVSSIATQLFIPTVEASLSINGTEVVAVPGQVGRVVDIEATLAPLEAQLRSLTDGLLPVVIKEVPPEILDARQQAEIARRILSAPLTIQIEGAQENDPGPWVFDQQTLAGMVTIERLETQQGAQYQVGLNAESLRGFLQDIATQLARQPQNARFIFNDDTRQLEVIQSAVIGRQLDVDATIQKVNQQLAEGQHTITLAFDYQEPAVVDTMTGEQLGITELVSSETSYFYGSSSARLQNIETAAARFHGVLVPPGATFSMGEVLGDVSLDNGYAEALIIFGNRTIQGVGGGVCQVSTTLFRTVFFGGYPINERHPHAYRVSYYEQTASGNVNERLAGLDATVFVPVVDFKFTNDTPYWLLMETYINVAARRLTWKFYSTSDGRSVDWDTTGLKNIEAAPEPLYQENPDLDKGEIKQVDWEADGADVTIYRTVKRGDQVYLQDTFGTHYLPWRAVYEYGPGTKIPKDNRDNDE